jgi:hypothetical protein
MAGFPGLLKEFMSISAIVLTVRAHGARHAAYRRTSPVADPRCPARIGPVTPALLGVG